MQGTVRWSMTTKNKNVLKLYYNRFLKTFKKKSNMQYIILNDGRFDFAFKYARFLLKAKFCNDIYPGSLNILQRKRETNPDPQTAQTEHSLKHIHTSRAGQNLH